MNKNISTVDYTDSFNTFFVKDVDDIKQINKDNVKNALGIGVVTGATAEAESTLTLTDSIEKPFELHLYGKSTQDGTPTPDNPIDIVSVINPTLTINNGADLSQTKQFNYVLRGIGNLKDELIIYADGTGKLIKNCYAESINMVKEINAKYKYGYRFTQSIKYPPLDKVTFLCDSALYSSSAGIVNTDTCKDGIRIGGADSTTVVLQFETDKNAIDITILYTLATPIITELTAEQIGIILNTYNGITNIFTDQSAGIKAVYTADTKGYIDRKFDELATALVAQTSEQ